TAGVFGEDGIFTPAEVNRYGQITYGTLNGHDIFHGWLMGNAMSGTSWGKLIRRDLFVKAYEHIPYTECNMAEDFLLFFFISQYAKRYVGIQDKVYKYGLSSGMSSVRRIDTLHKWKMVCSAASVFSVIVQWIEQENEAGRQPLAEDEINDIRRRTSFYLANNLKQLKETVVPELQSEAHQMLCDYWGQHFVERIEEMIKSSE
ncbi:MAG: glycosyltransferase family 2 protein, partial [Spirochaetales bacterium]|nr:glycosyltransferase family 2 protein [Spirochaetales bacterium]